MLQVKDPILLEELARMHARERMAFLRGQCARLLRDYAHHLNEEDRRALAAMRRRHDRPSAGRGADC